jgi:predicted nucleic acid-binding protein
MNIVDSSGWLEHLADGPNANIFSPILENTAELLVPTISIYEVFKRVLQQRNEDVAFQVAVSMQQGRVIELDTSLALSAAKLSANLKLPMADSVILATARAYDAVLWTQDADFEDVEGVRYCPKQPMVEPAPADEDAR